MNELSVPERELPEPGDVEPKLDKLSLAAGAVVFRQGEDGDAAYILDKGKIVIFQQVEGQRVELDSIKPGEIFGEMAVIDRSERMATAIAAVDSVVTRVPEPLFARRLNGADKFVRALVSMFIKNIRSSHRIFVRRPRSFRDNIKLIRHFSVNLKRYANLIDDRPLAEEMLTVLAQLDKSITDLARVGQRANDKRHDHIVEDGDESSVGMKAVMGTEGRRTL